MLASSQAASGRSERASATHCWHDGEATVTPFWTPPADEITGIDEGEAEETESAEMDDREA